MAELSARNHYNPSITTQPPYHLIGSALQTARHQVKRPWFAYVTLFVLQLKVVWGAWQYRDLTVGDTSAYFTAAYGWYSDFLVNIVWSPLYTAFYGSLLYFSPDAYVVTILHRLIIVFVVALMVLALMRRLLPPGLAWLTAAWWTILPINFDTLYEVHLFALIPVLAAWLLILYRPNSWTRGGAIAILFGASILVRNELMVATAILALICLGWEIWLAKKNGAVLPLLTYVAGYGLPLLLVILLCFFFYTRSFIQYPELSYWSADKHQVNMCMVYANSYQQRHSDWTKNPWTECGDLMERDFGEQLLPLSEMFRRNPAAVWEHFRWNISLTPNGLQVLLFNATSGTLNPDFASVQLGSSRALILSLVVVAVWGVGLARLYQERHYWWNFWLRDRALGWLAMLAVAAVACLIIPTQRPRPSYIFSLSLLMMALTGMSVFVIAHRRLIFKRLSGWTPLAMIAVFLATPNYYSNPEHIRPRQLHEVYRRLAPFEQTMTRGDTVLLSVDAVAVCNYLGHGKCQGVDYNTILSGGLKEQPLENFLQEQKITLIYVDEAIKSLLIQKNPSLVNQFLTNSEAFGWQLIAFQKEDDGDWMLFAKR